MSNSNTLKEQKQSQLYCNHENGTWTCTGNVGDRPGNILNMKCSQCDLSFSYKVAWKITRGGWNDLKIEPSEPSK